MHNRGAAAASEAGQEPSPAASADSASVGDASAMPETQASIESPSSGNRTSSAAGADKTMLTGTGVVPGVPVSSGKAKPKTVSFSFVYLHRLHPFHVCLQCKHGLYDCLHPAWACCHSKARAGPGDLLTSHMKTPLFEGVGFQTAC